MADPLEFEFRAEGDRRLNEALDRTNRSLAELEKETEEATSAQKKMGTSSDKTSSSLGDFKTKALAAGAAITGVALALRKAYQAAQEFFAEFERQAGIINRFEGNITDASDRVNGLISDLKLMEAQNKLTRAGVSTTSEEFGTLTVAATELAAATGGDASEGLNKLINAVARGQAGVLKELGVDITTVTDVSEKQALAIEKLQEKYGDAESSADTLGGQLDVLSVRLDNAETEFFEGLAATDAMRESFDDLQGSIIGLQRLLGQDGEGPIGPLKAAAAGFAAVVSAAIDQVDNLIESLGFLGAAAGALAEGDWGRLMAAVKGFNEEAGKLGAQGFLEEFDRRLEESMRQIVVSDASERGRMAAEEAFAGVDRGGGGRGRGGGGGAAGEGGDEGLGLSQLGTDILGETESQPGLFGPDAGFQSAEAGLESGASQSLETFRELQEIVKELAGDLDEVAEEAAKVGEEAKESAEIIEDNIGDGLRTTIGLAGSLTEMIVRGQEEQIAAFLKAKAISFAIQSGEQFALYLAKVFILGKQAEAAGHLAAGIKFASLAALAGGGAGIASAAGGGGGGGRASADDQDRRDSGRSSGGGEFGGSGGGGGPTTVVVNVGPEVPADQLGRLQKRWQRESDKLDQRRVA